MPFGVELPENLGQTSENTQAEEPKQDLEVSKAEGTETPSILDLDKLERFRFGDREWSPKELQQSILMQSDYSKKTLELAEERKYNENFPSDLQTLMANPGRMDEFRKLYPKQYIQIAEAALSRLPAGQKQQTSEQPKVDDVVTKKLQEIEGTLGEWQKAQLQGEVQKIQAWLDSQYETLGKKYPYANDEVISARAEVLSNRGTEITKEVLEKLFKQNDGEIKGNWEKMYKEKVTKQLEVGQKSKDTGSGGGIPGNAPKGFKTIKEATSAFLEDVGAR